MTRTRDSVRLRPTRAVHLLALITIVALLMLVTTLLLNMRRQELARAHRETTSLVRMLAEQTEQAFLGTESVLKGVQERMQSPFGMRLGLESEPVRLLLGTRKHGMRQVRALFVVDASGIIRNASMPGLDGTPWRVSPSTLAAIAGAGPSDLYVSHPMHFGSPDVWTVYLAHRLVGSNGSFRGAIVAAMNLKYFENYYAYMEQGFLQPVGLYHDDSTLVASLPRRSGTLGRPARELGGVELSTAGSMPINVASRDIGGGGDGMILAHVEGLPLLVGMRENSDQALAEWRHAAIPILISTSLVCLFILIAAGLLVIELRRESRLTSALREADNRYRLTFDSVKDAIVSVDESQSIVMFNPAAESMFGLPAEQAIGMPLDRLLPGRQREAHGQHVQHFMQAPEPSREMALRTAVHGVRADGSEFPIESAISRTRIDGKMQLTAVLRDVTERNRKDAQLRKVNADLRRLSSDLQRVREQERTRISRELHDDLGQQLTGMKLELTWLKGRLQEHGGSELLESFRDMLDHAITSVRRLSSELRPWILEERDLGDALAWQVEEMTRRTKVRYACHLPAAHLVHEEALATALYRIAQEALANVVRHAGARKVEVRLVQEEADLVLQVSDTGCGFVNGPASSGTGLVSMRERTTELGGHFTVTSTPGKGTTIKVRIPLATQAHVEEVTG